MQNSIRRLVSQVSSSGGGLPGCPDLARDLGRSLFGGKMAVDVPLGEESEALSGAVQFVEMVKFTVILACVSTASLS